MNFEHMARRSTDSDEEGDEREDYAIERAILEFERRPGATQGSGEELAGYISYAEMQELQRTLAELLHRILDLYLTFLVSLRETSSN